MPLHEEIKSRQGKSEACLERGPRPMQDLLEMTDPGQHRQYCLDQHPSIPGPPVTELEIGRITLLSVEGGGDCGGRGLAVLGSGLVCDGACHVSRWRLCRAVRLLSPSA